MKYYLEITKPNGEKVRLEVKSGAVIPVDPGDDVLVLDENGQPAEVALRPDGDDLNLTFENGEKVTLDDFYKQNEDGDPVTVSLRRPDDLGDYDFNGAEFGSLEIGDDFSLMRFSNVKLRSFDDQRPIFNSAPIGASVGSGAGGGGGSSEPPAVLPPTVPATSVSIDEEPVMTPDQGAASEDNPINLDILANDFDPEGGALTLDFLGGVPALVGQPIALPSGAIVTLLANGTVDYDPGSAFQGLGDGETATDQFPYTVSDPAGNRQSSTVTVTINGVNDGPTAADDIGIVQENGLLTISPLDNDFDPDTNDSLFISNLDQPALGSAILNPDNTVTFDPGGDFEDLAEGQTTTQTFDYTISDGNGGTDTAQITITITGTNDAPVAQVATGTIAEDSATVGGSLVATDPDNGPVLTFDTATLSPGVNNLGDFTIAADGTWNFALDNANPTVQALGLGDSIVETFTYTVTDEHGASDTATINVTITGTNDAPVLASEVSAIVEPPTEDAIVTGELDATDVDTDAVLTYTPIVGAVGDSGYGTFSLQTDGKWSYTIDNSNPLIDQLGESDAVTDTITVTVTDENGATSTNTITVNVLGTNDAPVAVDDTASTNEDIAITLTPADLVASNDTDVEGDTLTITSVGNPINGTVVLAGVNVVFTPDVNYNGPATFEYTISDGNGGTDTATVTIAVGAVNDDPEADPAAGIVVEDIDPSVSGQLIASDPDGDDLSFTVATNVAGTGDYGLFSIDANGAWNYQLDDTDTAVDALSPGETLTDTYTYTVSDGNGGTDTETITITINGIDDLSEITVGAGDSDMGAVTEDVDTDAGTAGIQLEQSGTLTVTDADTSDTAAFDPTQTTLQSTTHTAQLGTLSINAAGAWDYSVDNANVQFLDTGETITEIYTVEATDGTTHDITITINGTDDLSEITVGAGDSDLGSVTEDVDTDAVATGIQLEQSGTLTVTDADTSDTAAFDPAQTTLQSTTHTAQLGTLSINAAGAWDYSVDNANVQFLDTGETITEIYTVKAVDGTTHDITIVINGTDDLSEITVGAGDSDMGAVTEDVDTNAVTAGIQLEQSGTLTVTDADTSDTAEFAPAQTVLSSTTHTAQLGTLSINAAGAWDYAVDNANVQFLDTGETITEIYTVEAVDGTTHDITITINGTDDLSEITVGTGDSDLGAVTEDVDTNAVTAGIQLEQSGTLTVTDADTSDAAAFDPTETILKSTTHTGPLGSLSIDASGNWDYSVDNASVQFLDTGETITEIYTVEAIDGTTHDITIVINGTDDLSEITVGSGDSDLGAVTEDFDTDAGTVGVQLEQSGTLTVTDADTSDTAAFDPTQTTLQSTTHTAQLGTLSITAAGAWDYSVDNANVQFLDTGETITEIYTVEATDGTTHDITITINGADDLSEITVGAGDSDLGTVTEDVDTDAGTAGIQLEQSGTLTVTDADTSDTAAFDPTQTTLQSTTHTAQLGTLSINAAGTWDYSVDNANVQFLDTGETITEIYTVGAVDGTTHDITITINGTDDLSEITVGAGDSDVGAVTEDVDTDAGTAGVQLEQSGTLTVTDADTSDTAAFDPTQTVLSSTTHTAQLGTLSINASGAWDYSVDNANVQFLDTGETITEVYTVEATDGTTHNITITINGADDLSEITVGAGDSDLGAVTEDVDTDAGSAGIQLEQSGTLTVTDADTSDTAAFDPTQTTLQSTTHTAQLGTLSINAAGAWDYSVNNTSVQFLDTGETITEVYTVEATDGTTHNITITINGTDDLSEITVGAGDSDMGAVTEDVDTDAGTAGIQLEQSGTLTVTDADTSDTAAFDPTETILKSTTHTGPLGSLSIDAAGNWDYAVDNASVQFLDTGETITEIYTVEATDGTTHDITITINGTDDLSEITVGSGDSDLGAVTEDFDTDPGTVGVQLEQSGTLTVTDADTTDPAAFDPTQTVLSSTTHTAQLGTLSINAAGAWDYAVDNANVQFLDTGETITEIYTVEAVDGTTHDITITINGTDDLSEITVGAGDSDMGAVTEDVDTDAGTAGIQLEQSGTLTVTDADTSDTAAFDPTQTTLQSTTHTVQLGTLSINAAGAWDYAVNNANVQFLGTGETITEIYTVKATDGTTHDITITINGTNDGPVAVDDTATTNEDTAIILTVADLVTPNDTDLEGDALTITSVDNPTNGTVEIVGVNVVFTPTANYNGPATFEYTISDGNGGTDTATVTVTVNSVNDGPNALDDSVAGTEDLALTLTNSDIVDPNDTDLEGDSLTIISVNNPTNGTVELVAGDVVFTPTVNYNGPATFDYTISDGNGGTDTATVTINLAPVNDDPVAVDDTNTIAEDTVAPITGDVEVNDTDLDGDTLVVGAVEGNAGDVGSSITTTFGTITINANGSYSYALDNGNATVQALGVGQSTTDVINYTIDDGHGGTDTASLTITITGTNDDPVAVNDTNTIAEDTVAPITGDVEVNDTDVDGDTLVVGAVEGNAGDVNSSVTTTFGTITINANGSYSYALDNGNATVQALGVGQSTTDVINYTIKDGNGGTDTATLTITITGTNDDPVAVNDTNTIAEDTVAPITGDVEVNDTDLDGDTLVVGAVEGNAGDVNSSVTTTYGTITINANGSYSYALDNSNATVQALGVGQSTTEVINYTISDGQGGTDTATLTITITGTNDGPLAVDDTNTIAEDTVAPITGDVEVNDTDLDGDTLVVGAVEGNSGDVGSSITTTFGAITINANGSYSYALDNTNATVQALGVGQSTTDVVNYTISDGQGGSDTATLTITITGTNDAPVANDDTVVSTTDILPVTIDVVSNDTDIDGTIDPTTVDLDTGTAGIQTTLNVAGEGVWTTDGSGNVTFTPATGITDQPTEITYEVADNNGATSQATISLKYSAADVWFGNDESGSVNNSDFSQSRALISGAADQMSFATGNLAFNAALFTWANSSNQQMELSITADKADFVSDSSTYSRNFSGGTDIGAGIVFGTSQIAAHVANMVANGDARADVPQVMVILTDAHSSQILNDSSLLADSQAAKDAGIILVFVAIQEAQDNPVAVARLEAASSLDANNNPLVITALSYADIDSGEIADLLNAIREAAAAGLLPPVVIDLDGDGVEFLGIEDGIEIDVDGDGDLEQSAWAGNDDAVLFYDADGDGEISGREEFVFADYGDDPNATDLEGLRDGFDTDGDLALSSGDEEWENFKLWQDADGDGQVGEGEVQTLEEAGIESIELISDGQAYYTAGGDVLVNGEATVNYTDGSTGIAADAEFNFSEIVDDASEPLEIITENGEVLSLDGGNEPVGEVGEDLLAVTEEASNPLPVDGAFIEGGSPSIPTGVEDDAAAANAAMS